MVLRLFALLLVLLILVVAKEKGRVGRDYWNAIPQYKATLKPSVTHTEANWTSSCFKTNTGRLTALSSKQFTLEFVANNANSTWCNDLYLIATRYSFHIKRILIHGSHKIVHDIKHDDEYQEIKNNGIFIFSIQDHVVGTLYDLIKLVGLFFGPESQVRRDNIKFLHEYMNITWIERSPEAAKSVVPIDESEIETGDMFAILNFYDGEPLILFGTGSTTDHAAVAVRIDGELYVAESAGMERTHGRVGIFKTPYKQWIQDCFKHDQLVTLLKLNKKSRQLFNESKALEFLSKSEGLPYGFHNFFFGWVDTPNMNFPPPLSDEMGMIGLSIFNKVMPDLAKKFFLEALSKRLDATQVLSFDQVVNECVKRNITFGELISIPEQDSWVYSDGPAMVCNVFVLRLYQEAGLFPGVTFQATESTPRDVYQLNIFETNPLAKPKSCKVKGDEDLPWCQLTGKYKLPLLGVGSMAPFNSMNERCGALPPSYIRTPDQC